MYTLLSMHANTRMLSGFLASKERVTAPLRDGSLYAHSPRPQNTRLYLTPGEARTIQKKYELTKSCSAFETTYGRLSMQYSPWATASKGIFGSTQSVLTRATQPRG